MADESTAPENDLPPPGRYGNITFLGSAELGNATPEELACPISRAKRPLTTFWAQAPEIGNATAEELAWPTVRTDETTPPSKSSRSPNMGLEPQRPSRRHRKSYSFSSYVRQQHLLANEGLIRSSWYRGTKPILDCLASVMLVLVLFPLMFVIGILVKLTSRGSALYLQTRLGRFAHPFRIVKFRTMTHNCETISGVRWASRNDSRVTPIGRFLRARILDELPQLINILRGEMSLIGPQSERPEFIPSLEKAVPHYRLRMLVKPGISGLAQICLPPHDTVDSVKKSTLYDLYYIRHLAFWLDLRLLCATLLHVVGVPSWLIRAMCLLPSAAQIEKGGELHSESESFRVEDETVSPIAIASPNFVDNYTFPDLTRLAP